MSDKTHTGAQPSSRTYASNPNARYQSHGRLRMEGPVFLTPHQAALALGLIRVGNPEAERRRNGLPPLTREEQHLLSYLANAAQQHQAGKLFLTTKQTAEILGIQRRRAEKLCEMKQLKAMKVGGKWRVLAESVYRRLQRQQVEAVSGEDVESGHQSDVKVRRHPHLREWQDPTGNEAVQRVDNERTHGFAS